MQHPLKKTKYITVCFEYSEEFKGQNPFDIKSDFGTPVQIGIGNEFDAADRMRDRLFELGEDGEDAA